MTPVSPAARASAYWLYGFVVLQFVCQIALLAPLGSPRIVFRATTFASSLLLLILVPGGGRPYPARLLVVVLIVLTGLGLLHPNLNTMSSGLAQVGLTLAVWAPLFWTTRVELAPQALRTLILLLWGFHTLSSVVGVLQVYDPNRFAPDPRFVQELYGDYADALKIKIANGQTVWRPMGLTDSPGGAAVSGQFAFLAGLILAIRERGLGLRLAGLLGALAGMFCIYLCQIRTTVVLTGIGVLVFTVLNAARQRADRAVLVGALGGGVVLAALAWASDVGGTVVTDRLATLTAERADQVYYSNRGIFLQDMLEKIPEFPLGAGLGRWGMMANYFGDPLNPSSKPLHAEIQAAAWLYDGGLLLLIAGYLAIFAACAMSLRIALQARDSRLVDWAALVVALDVGIIANTLTYPVFASQMGMMCLLLNGALYAAAASRGRRPSIP